MTNWRPPNWDIVRIIERLRLPSDGMGMVDWEVVESLVEAGADAIYGAIKDRVVEIGREVGRDDLEFRVQVAAWLIG